MTKDTLKAVIDDAHDLAASAKDPMLRLAIDGIASRLQALDGRQVYVTPAAALETVAGARPLDAVFSNPPFDASKMRLVEHRDWLELPRNVKLQRYVQSDRKTMFVGQYVNAKDKSPAVMPSRIYRIDVRYKEYCKNWCASIFEDGKLMIEMNSFLNRAHSEYAAVKALKYILTSKIRNCAKAHRRRKAAAPRASEAASTKKGAE